MIQTRRTTPKSPRNLRKDRNQSLLLLHAQTITRRRQYKRSSLSLGPSLTGPGCRSCALRIKRRLESWCASWLRRQGRGRRLHKGTNRRRINWLRGWRSLNSKRRSMSWRRTRSRANSLNRSDCFNKWSKWRNKPKIIRVSKSRSCKDSSWSWLLENNKRKRGSNKHWLMHSRSLQSSKLAIRPVFLTCKIFCSTRQSHPSQTSKLISW